VLEMLGFNSFFLNQWIFLSIDLLFLTLLVFLSTGKAVICLEKGNFVSGKLCHLRKIPICVWQLYEREERNSIPIWNPQLETLEDISRHIDSIYEEK